MLIWIIDDEWNDYIMEEKLLKQEFPNVEIKISNENYKRDLIDFGHKADGILAQVSFKLDKSFIDKLKNCKCISVYGTGYENIDVESCKMNNIKVAYVPDYSSEDIADYVLAAIFNYNKRICEHSRNFNKYIIEGHWGSKAIHKDVHRLSNQKLFIAGLGRIGEVVAAKANAVGINVLGYSRSKSSEYMENLNIKKVEWEEGFKTADYISVHLKSVPENKDIISSKEFELMKETSYLINTSRGNIIDEQSLIDALSKNKIAGATLDVFKEEPPSINNKLLSLGNVFLTPHISYHSVEALWNLKNIAISNLIANLMGKYINNIII